MTNRVRMAFLTLGLAGSAATAAPVCGDWSIVDTPDPPSGNNALIGLGVSSPDRAYALRGGGAGSFLHMWDGAGWTEVSNPNLDVEGSFSPRAITAVDGSAWVASLVATGVGGPGLQHLLRWTGTDWDLETWTELSETADGFPRSGSPEDMDGVSADDIWIVGKATSTGDPVAGTPMLTLHWNGTELVEYLTPGVGNRQNWLTGVTAIAPDDAWAVGYYNTTGGGGHFRGVVYHWDGTEWTHLVTPVEGLAGSFLQDVDAIAADDVWAVGEVLGEPLFMHYDGSEWTIAPSPPTSLAHSVHKVAAAATDDVWAVSVGNEKRFYHYDGVAWAKVEFPEVPGATNIDLHGAMGTSGSCDVWAVGGQTLDGRIYTLAAHLGTDVVSVGDVASHPLRYLRAAPNPFRGTTRVTLELTVTSDIVLELFDAAGRRVRSHRHTAMPAGPQAVTLSADDLSPGAYWLRATASDIAETRRIVIAP